MGRFWQSKASAIFVWVGEEKLRIGFDALTFVVPARNETAYLREGAVGLPWTHESARFPSGGLIPGTIVVEDVTDTTNEGGFVQRLSVDRFCRFLERDRAELFERGFDIVQKTEDVKAAMELALPRYNKSQDVHAREIIATEMERQKRYIDKGAPIPPSSSSSKVDWAVRHLMNRPVETVQYKTDDLARVLEGRLTRPPETQLPPPAIVSAGPPSGEDLLDQAEAVGVKLNTVELRGLVKNDPAVMQVVSEKIAARYEDAEKRKAAQQREEELGKQLDASEPPSVSPLI